MTRFVYVSYSHGIDVDCPSPRRNGPQFVVLTLDHPAARNAILELCGPAAISPLEVVRAFEQAGGRPFTVEHVPEEALRA